jgi:hypothetical protein
MSSISPASVLYSSDGYELATSNGVAIPANTRGLLIEGSDGTTSRFVSVDTSGRPVIVGAGTAGAAAGGVLTIQGSATGTPIPISGTITASNSSIGTTGSAPPASATYIGGSVTTAAPAYTTGQLNALSLTTTGLLRVDGTGGLFNNSATSATGAAPPASASYTAGSVTTAAPTYTTGQMSALSLTTTGLLRVDGTGGSFPVSGTVTANIGTVGTLALDATVAKLTIAQSTALGTNTQALVGGSVTTAAPTYTTGNINPLSLTTGGALRVDASATTVTVQGAGTAGTPGTAVLTVQGIAGGKPMPVTTDVSTSATITSVAGSATSVSLLASNANRILATIYNESSSRLYIACAATASATAYTVQIFPNSYWELPASYTGAISGIWNNAAGNARITEFV